MAAAVSNSGTIVTEGGQVFMQASAAAGVMASVLQTGRIDTSGEQGGKVTLLADGGDIRVSGSITANSTGKNDQGQARAGGDIVIGRDEATGVLAATSDVSGARLESKGGFIETSGQYLTADGVSIQAATWLIDPVDIEINSSGTPTQTAYSQISNQTINAALNGGSSVVVSTAGSGASSAGGLTAGTSTGGNILVSGAIAKTTGGDASLTLTADNGLTVNKAITSSSGTLNINLTANGRTNGTAVASMTTTERALSRGLFINASTLNANGGDITLTGTSYADATGYNATTAPNGNANASITNAIGKGVQIHNGSSLSGKNITITGVSETLAGATGTGVLIQKFPSVSNFTATGDISIIGTQQGLGSGNGLWLAWSDNGGTAPTMNAGGNITLRGNNRVAANTANAVYINSGLQAKAAGNIVVKAETANAATNAIYFYSRSGAALEGNVSLQFINSNGVANGDVLVQSNQGGIFFNNLLPNRSSTFETKIVGKNITIDNTGGTLTDQTSTTASITPKALTLAAVSDSKTYDGTISSTARVAVNGLVSTDTVTGATQSFDSKNVLGTDGSTLKVNSSYTVNDGNSGNNYSVTSTTASGTVTPLAATVTASGARKVFNGLLQSLAPATSSGFLAGDQINITGLASGSLPGQYASNLKATGTDAGNYSITYQNATLEILPISSSINLLKTTENPNVNPETRIAYQGFSATGAAVGGKSAAIAEPSCTPERDTNCDCEVNLELALEICLPNKNGSALALAP
jgi:hypothetical protein